MHYGKTFISGSYRTPQLCHLVLWSIMTYQTLIYIHILGDYSFKYSNEYITDLCLPLWHRTCQVNSRGRERGLTPTACWEWANTMQSKEASRSQWAYYAYRHAMHIISYFETYTVIDVYMDGWREIGGRFTDEETDWRPDGWATVDRGMAKATTTRVRKYCWERSLNYAWGSFDGNNPKHKWIWKLTIWCGANKSERHRSPPLASSQIISCTLIKAPLIRGN